MKKIIYDVGPPRNGFEKNNNNPSKQRNWEDEKERLFKNNADKSRAVILS